MIKFVIIYHQIKSGVDCPDGVCGLWIIHKFLTANYPDCSIEIVPDCYLNNEEYNKPDYRLPFDPTSKDVIIVDFSYPRHILELIVDKADMLTVLDHHKSRMNDIQSLSSRVFGGFSGDDCGATYAWKYFFSQNFSSTNIDNNQPEPWFLKHVRRRDIGADGYYEGDTPESEAITIAMSARRKGKVGKAAFEVFEELLNCREEDLIAEGMPLIVEREPLLREALEQYNGALLQVGEYLVPYYHLTNPKAHKHYSVIGSQAAKQHPDSPFIAIVTDNPLKISLRAGKNSTVDLSVLAESLGGGGHERASGYEIPRK